MPSHVGERQSKLSPSGLIRTLILLDQCLTLMTSFNLITFIKGLPSNTATLGAGLQHVYFGGI